MMDLLKKRMHRACVLGLSAALFVGCGDESSETWDEPLRISAPIEVGANLAYVDRTMDRVFVLSPERDGDDVKLAIHDANAGSTPGVTAASADGTSLYIVDEAAEVLRIHDITDPSSVTKVPLQAAYDRIAVDPEGEFVVLSFSGLGDDQVVARTLNEVGIIDLRGAEPSTYFVTLSTRANEFVFAPPFTLGDQQQRLMAVLADNEVTVFDLLADNDEDRLREIPLTTSEAQSVRVPRQALFDLTKDTEADLYVRAEGLDDVSRVTIRTSPDGAKRKLAISTDVLTLNAPARISLLTLPNATRLLSINRVRPEMTLVDTVSNVSATFELPMSAPATNLLTYTTVIEDDGAPREETRVLAYSPNSQLITVIRPETISVDGEEPTLGRSVEAIRLDSFPSSIELSAVRPDQAIVFHQGFRGGFTLLNLAKNNDVPIQGGGLRDVIFDGTFAYAIFQSLPNLTIFADDGHPTNFDLPQIASHIKLDQEDGLVIVQHPSDTGKFTVLDANDPRPSNARVYVGVFIKDLFAQEL